MLTIIVGQETHWDEANEEFVELSGTKLELEHSLVSLSKWESEYQKPFLESKELTAEELLAYIKAMLLLPVPDEVLVEITNEDVMKINDYVGSPQSATTFVETRARGGRSERVTSELIYYWMVVYQIPFVCETWHLNRLLNLIKICSIKNAKPQKMSKAEQTQQMREMNAARRANLGTSG